MKKIKVIKQYRSNYPNPLKLSKGESVEIGIHEEEYPGWKWGITGDGNKGWIPEAYLKIEGTTGTLTRDYDATELGVDVGDELVFILEESGWIQCITEAGSIGWVPKECLELG